MAATQLGLDGWTNPTESLGDRVNQPPPKGRATAEANTGFAGEVVPNWLIKTLDREFGFTLVVSAGIGGGAISNALLILNPDAGATTVRENHRAYD